MPLPISQGAKRKRNRKRRRRIASDSSSSSSSSSSEAESEVGSENLSKAPATISAPVVAAATSSSESSSASESESESEVQSDQDVPMDSSPVEADGVPKKTVQPLRVSPSPSPPPTELPSFLPERSAKSREIEEENMKEKFRKFWMSSVADGFKDDLEEIRKEPNLDTSRLAMLIESLASGADVFQSSTQTQDGTDINEIDVILQ